MEFTAEIADLTAATATSEPAGADFTPLMTQAASLQILDFMSDGTLTACAANIQGFCPTGDATGTLPSTLTFDNGTVFNDYFDDLTFGTTLSFDVRLYGAAVNAPNGAATSGSTFAFSMFSDAAGTMPVLTTDLVNGFAATIDVNLDGSTTVNNFSSQATEVPAGPVPAVPEPSSFALLGTAIACVGLAKFRRHKRRGQPLPTRPAGKNLPAELDTLIWPTLIV